MHSGYIMDTFWIHVGYMLDTCWVHSRYNLNTFWMHSGYVLDTLWIHSGYMLDTFWVHSVYILDTCWIQSGYILDTCWILGNIGRSIGHVMRRRGDELGNWTPGGRHTDEVFEASRRSGLRPGSGRPEWVATQRVMRIIHAELP